MAAAAFLHATWIAALALSPSAEGDDAAATPPAVEAPAAPDAREAPATQGPQNSGVDQAIENYRQDINRLKSESGPYDPELGEQYFGLAVNYEAAGKHKNAIEALNQALHIKKVNRGLQSLDQVPILHRLVENEIASDDWEGLDITYQQLLWIYRRNFSETDPALLPVVDTVGRWKLKAYSEKLLKQSPLLTLNEAEQLYHGTVQILSKKYGGHDLRLVDPLYGEAMVAYQLTGEMNKRKQESLGPQEPLLETTYMESCIVFAGRQVCRAIPVTRPNYSAMLRRRMKENNVHTHFLAAERALRYVVEIYEDNPKADIGDKAQAIIHLGDWNLLDGRRDTAMDLYRQAYKTLYDGGAGREEIEKYFGMPRAVPSLRLPLENVDEHIKEKRQPAYVVASVDITSKGRARNFEVIGESLPSSIGLRRKAKEAIMQSKFRPRFVDGEPVETTGFKINYTGN